MKFRRIAVVAVCLLGGISVPAVTVEEDFRGYPDFDSAHHRWMFRGVGGEVIDGEYRFNGVSIEEPIQPDIRPLLVLGMPRDFPAGPSLRLEAEIAVGRRGYSFLPAKGDLPGASAWRFCRGPSPGGTGIRRIFPWSC
ncbi:MAG: hypothetical protein L6W00_15185 [Lentisphaeria bacterium]|nr:MAG: hypothetical protein L6W00_15185 [Lentisphaeria bacterium]